MRGGLSMKAYMYADVRVLPHIFEEFEGTQKECNAWVAAKAQEIMEFAKQPVRVYPALTIRDSDDDFFIVGTLNKFFVSFSFKEDEV
jgi:hypothetical protein